MPRACSTISKVLARALLLDERVAPAAGVRAVAPVRVAARQVAAQRGSGPSRRCRARRARRSRAPRPCAPDAPDLVEGRLARQHDPLIPALLPEVHGQVVERGHLRGQVDVAPTPASLTSVIMPGSETMTRVEGKRARRGEIFPGGGDVVLRAGMSSREKRFSRRAPAQKARAAAMSPRAEIIGLAAEVEAIAAKVHRVRAVAHGEPELFGVSRGSDDLGASSLWRVDEAILLCPSGRSPRRCCAPPWYSRNNASRRCGRRKYRKGTSAGE